MRGVYVAFKRNEFILHSVHTLLQSVACASTQHLPRQRRHDVSLDRRHVNL